MNTTLRKSAYRALAMMYIAQGLPTGFAFYALGSLIRNAGYSVTEVGLTGLAFLPWAFKFLWAGPVDNACLRWGHARVIFFAQTLAVLTCIAVIPLPLASHLAGALSGIILLNVICATQDIATNAWAVLRMQGKTAGAANAIQIAGFIFGMLLGGGGLLIVHSHVGWHFTMALLAALMAVIGGVLLLDKPWQSAVALQSTAGRVKVRLRDLLHHRDLGWAIGIALLFKFPGTAVNTLLQPWMVDRGMGIDAIGHLQIAMMLATSAGAILIGVPLVRRLGNRRAVIISYLMATLMLGMAWSLETAGASALWWCYLALCAQAVFEGAMFVAIWALFMNWSSPAHPGTDFTAMQCSENLANAVAAGLIGGLGQMLGYAHAFALIWLSGACVLIIITLCLRRLTLQTGKTS
ncbi:MFS transporter [Affinibrenneria salicis]|uniref:MFS transporter n=1 Tax=Affinibrenneria salicis TaxID=2590031 RepID=A0A5J5FTW7_9GAMM|nr:MFS transporter [Affinibrenneria salicis]KAA8996654.1 MFS transporter [Affinibrenneria salicis]